MMSNLAAMDPVAPAVLSTVEDVAMTRALRQISCTLVAAIVWSSASLAVPAGFANEVVVPDITAATTMAFLPDGRMLVGELGETVWVVQAGASAPDPTPFLSITGSGYLTGEQGLMDIRPDPGFASNHYYYVFYTHGTASANHNRLSRFTASGNGTLANSELVLWEDDQTAQDGHHGGGIAFGNDGKIYFTQGENFLPEYAQDLSSYRGKVMRINADGTVPTDNPFYDGNGPHKDQIWAYGLRNPFRISTDPVTGRIYIADVGEDSFEEVNLGVAGANYGWPLCEGSCPQQPGVTSPIYAYSHGNRDASITGGFVYRGTQFPAEYQGSYFFADYVQNWIKRLTFDAAGNVTGASNFEPIDGAADGPYGDPVKLVQGPDGSLYYVDIGFNNDHVPNEAGIRRIRYTPTNAPPVATASANPVSGPPPLLVSFSSAGSYDPEGAALSYAWTFGDGVTSTLQNPTHTYATKGAYVARLTVSDGVQNAQSSGIAISVGNRPTAVIRGPANNTPFRAGDSIGYWGTASDAEDGTLPASAFSWTILFHHDSHVHPAGGPFNGVVGGVLSIPTSGHSFEGATWYEIILTVTDSDGLSGSQSVAVIPDKVNLSFDTVPSGRSLEVDGIRKTAPFVVDTLIGFSHLIYAPGQTNGATSYLFRSWSDGGAASHSIVVPATSQAYSATFTAAPSGLVAAYAFEEGSGAGVTDASGNANHGTLSNAARTFSGRYGSALVFNGANALVSIPDSSSLDLSAAMTLEAWVYPVSLGSWRDVIYKGLNDIYYLGGSSSQGSRPAVGGTFASSPLYGPNAVPVGAWTHLAATYDGAMLRLFVGGTEVASRAQSGPIQAGTGALTLGGDPTYGQWWAGRIDDVRVYDRALSATEIQSDLATPVPEPAALPVLFAGGLLVAWLRRRRPAMPR
jgi:glucose/arabinose dehydrogenase